MSAQPALAPTSAVHASQYRNLVEFLEVRSAHWAQLQPQLDPGDALLPSLNALWTQEWMQAHAGVFAARAKATAGLGIQDLERYGALGGLKQCVTDLHARSAEVERLRDEKLALVTALEHIAGHRHAYLAQQTPEQMLDKIALIAHEALAYGRPAQQPVPVPPTPAPTEEGVGLDLRSSAGGVGGDAEAQAEETASTTQGPADPERTDAIPISDGMQIFTAQKFRVMADIRRLSMEDGEAYPAIGDTYDGAKRLDPSAPIPQGVSHVAWKEFVANP